MAIRSSSAATISSNPAISTREARRAIAAKEKSPSAGTSVRTSKAP
jgi:hypothetical protein